MSMIDSRQLIQDCCYSYASKNLQHAAEALKKDNIAGDITVKTDSIAISALKDQYHGEAIFLGKSLGRISGAIHKVIQDQETEEEGTRDLNEMEREIYAAIVGKLKDQDPEGQRQFSREFETFVTSYNREVCGPPKTAHVLKKTTKELDLDIPLYRMGMQVLANQDTGDRRAEQFQREGALRPRFDERIARLTEGQDRLPHFERALNSQDGARLEEIFALIAQEIGVEQLDGKQKQAITQAYIDYPQIKEDTIKFSGELFMLPKESKVYREVSLSAPRLSKVTLLSPENRARELSDILAIGDLFSSPSFPLLNVVPIKAGRMLQHEILMHLMLDRGARDEGLKDLEIPIREKILEKNPTLLGDVEEKRSSVERLAVEKLGQTEIDTVENLEQFCAEMLGIGGSKEELNQVLQGLDREKFVADLRGGDKSSLQKALAMRLGDCAARNFIKAAVNEIINTAEINAIPGLPPRVPVVPLSERRAFTMNGGAASGKSTAVRLMLGDEGHKIEGMPERSHIVTITRDSLMTSLLDPDALSKEDIDYFAAYAYDEAVLIAEDAERTRRAREKEEGRGPHVFYDQVAPEIRRYEVGLASGGMDGGIVSMPVETSVLLAQLRGEKERRYAGRFCVLLSHKTQVDGQRKVLEYLRGRQNEGVSLDHVRTKIDTKVDKDLNPYLSVNFDFKGKTMDVKSAGYFFDFLKKASINLNAETLGDLYDPLPDAGYAELFMGYANQFDNVKLRVLKEDFTEEVVEFSRADYPELKQALESGEYSSSVQRSRQNQFKSLSNANSFLEKADKAENAEDLNKFLKLAEAQVKDYLLEFGDQGGVTGNAGKNIAQLQLQRIAELRTKVF